MQQTCQRTGKIFEISPKEVELCRKMNLPLPLLSPEERIRDAASARNERKLYRRKCDSSNEEMISAYTSETVFPVYKNEIWWGDTWTAEKYGRDYNFDKPFFEQFKELQNVVPRAGTSVFQSENCEFNSHVRRSRNCYLNWLATDSEDLYYSYWMVKDKDCLDCMVMNDSTQCYYCRDCNDAYNCICLQESNNCSDCFFSYQLRGCQNCIFCTNLVDKTYYIRNQKCTQFDFEKKKKEIFNGSYETWKKYYQYYLEEVMKKSLHRALHNLNCENCTGDHLVNCRNCDNCYESFGCEDNVNCISMGETRDGHSCYSGGWPGSDRIYYSSVIRGCTDTAFCTDIWTSSDLRYCDSCQSCNHCFGCIGLKHKEYFILNKPYSREEYEEILPRIIKHMGKTGEWGQFFPPKLIVFAYNETAAQDLFPLTKEQAFDFGFHWKEEEQKKIISATAKNIPDNVNDVEENFIKEVLICENCGKNYKIILPELKFYKRLGVPIPHACPECRHEERFHQKNPRQLHTRNCARCNNEILSTYAENRPEKILCDECYLQVLH